MRKSISKLLTKSWTSSHCTSELINWKINLLL